MGTRRLSGDTAVGSTVGLAVEELQATRDEGRDEIMTENHESPYEILGLEESATEREIKKRYRRLSRMFHPDLNPDDPQAEENFKKVQWAYRCLTAGPSSKSLEKPPQGYRGEAHAFVDDVHPFHGFFAALRAYSIKTREKKNKEEDEGK